MRDAVIALRAELRRRGVVVAPALLVGLCRMNAPAQANLVPSSLMSELGKMAIVGKPRRRRSHGIRSAPGATPPPGLMAGPPNSSSRPSPRSQRPPSVIVATVLMLRGVMVDESKRATSSPGALVEQRHEPTVPRHELLPPKPRSRVPLIAPGTDVRVLSAGERSPRQIVLSAGQNRPMPTEPSPHLRRRPAIQVGQPLARKLIETQAGKTLEQLTEESRKNADP